MFLFLVKLSTLASIIKLIVLLILFIALLLGAHFFTKWYAKHGVTGGSNRNINIIESKQLAPGKSISIVKIGNKYVSFISGKDFATLLTELGEDDLDLSTNRNGESPSFKELLSKMKKEKNEE